MDRILQSTQATISVKFAIDGVPVDPAGSNVTVGVFRADGSEVVALGTSATRADTGIYSTILSPAHTVLLDTLTATWTTLDLGTMTTTVEVVGGFLFTIGQLRAFNNGALADAVKYPTADLTSTRTMVEDAIESELGYALVPRFSTVTVGYGASSIRLSPYITAIRSINDATSDLTVADLGLIVDGPAGFLSGYRFTGPTIIGYEHGLSTPPPRASTIGLLLAKSWAISGPIDDRTTTISNAETGLTSVFATPGIGGSIFGLPAVDQWVKSERLIGVA